MPSRRPKPPPPEVQPFLTEIGTALDAIANGEASQEQADALYRSLTAPYRSPSIWRLPVDRLPGIHHSQPPLAKSSA